MLRSSLLTISVSVAVLVSACGGTDGSTFGDGNNGNNNNGEHDGYIGAGEIKGDAVGPQGTTDACVNSTANASLQTANLIMMVDKSGSMGDNTSPGQNFNPEERWIPVTTGLVAFFEDPGSVGLNASLQFFPLGQGVAGVCAFPYDQPKVALSPLTSKTPFVDAINVTKPEGGTPTLPALKGAIAYAKQIAAQRPGEKPVVVLVTDGEPGIVVDKGGGQTAFEDGCPGNNVPGVAAAAKAAFEGTPSIPTFVIGVGPQVSSLNQVAVAGGTKQAVIVPVDNPASTKAQIQSALTSIRSQTATCDFVLPPPPAGKTINANAVNVVYKPSGSGAQQVLTYSADCAQADGWHYDSTTKPTKVILCKDSCSRAQRDRGGKIELAFGCLTKTALK